MIVKSKRQCFRLEVHISVRYKIAKRVGQGEYKVSKYFKGMGQDFSDQSAAIKVNKPLPVNTLLYLEMSFPFQDEPVLATAEVVRCEKGKFKGKTVPLIMVRFILINETVHNAMTSFIISRGKNIGEVEI